VCLFSFSLAAVSINKADLNFVTAAGWTTHSFVFSGRRRTPEEENKEEAEGDLAS
jgi:hypothetical protein